MRARSLIQRYGLWGGVALLMSLMQLSPALFWLQTNDMWGQPWRWWTGHWVHFDMQHLALNTVTWLILPSLFPRLRWHSQQIIVALGLLVLPAGMSWLWVYVEPSTTIYAGLSGILHGLYGYAALEAVAHKQFDSPEIMSDRIAVLIFVGLIVKLTVEYWTGEPVHHWLAIQVATQMHLIGFLMGLGYFCMVDFIMGRIQKTS